MAKPPSCTSMWWAVSATFGNQWLLTSADLSTVMEGVWYSVLWTLVYTKKRRIESVWEKCRQKVLPKELQESDDSVIADYLQPVNTAYWLIKEHFPYTDRRMTQERYLDHLVRTTYNVLERTPEPSRLTVLISLLHDAIENTDITFAQIMGFFRDTKLWKKVALWVLLLSKKSIKDFIDFNTDSTDYQSFQEIQRFSNAKEKSWWQEMRMVNTKWFITREFKYRNKNDSLSSKEKRMLSNYSTLKAKLKSSIDNDYYPKFETVDNMIAEAKGLNIKRSLWLSPEEIREVALASLDAKDADRLDNLETEHQSSGKKIRKKIWEFNTYFRDRIAETKPDLMVHFELAITSLNAELSMRSNDT